MAFEDLKEQAREQLTTLVARIQESSAWNEIVERYLDLNPPVQKAVLALSGALAALILFMLPYMFFSSSQDNMSYFEDKKQTMRELYQVSRAVNVLPPAPPPMTLEDLRNSVQSILNTERPPLLPEQIVSVVDYDNTKTAGATLPRSLSQQGVAVNLSRLNVDQITRLSGRLQSMRSTLKVTGIKIQASAQDPHYFDVSYRLVAFGIPAAPAATPAPPGRRTN